MGDGERDPEQAIDDIGSDLAEGGEPSGDEREFLESERVDPGADDRIADSGSTPASDEFDAGKELGGG